MTAPQAFRIDVSEADYHADKLPGVIGPSLSNSLAKVLLDKSPRHAEHKHPRMGNGSPTHSAVFDRGALAHKLILGKGAIVEVINADDYKTKAAKDARDEAHAAGRIPALAALHGAALIGAEIVRGKLARLGIDLDGESEVQLAWQEETHERLVWCRGMLDHVTLPGSNSAVIYDLKTTRSAHPRAISTAVVNYGYDTQRAAYIRALEATHPELRGQVEFRFIFAEWEPPYAVTVGVLDDTLIARGEERWRLALDLWSECLAFGKWPEYADEIVTIEAPSWMQGDIEIGFEEE